MFAKSPNSKEFAIQSDIIKQTLLSQETSLDKLIELMIKNAQPSLYLAGTVIDHEYFLATSDIAMSISILPLDAKKASMPAYHPNSTEAYIIFKGSLIMELAEHRSARPYTLRQYDIKVIPPGKCHRIKYEPAQSAASLIVKTNLTGDPKVVRCVDENGNFACKRHKDPSKCPLFKSWLEEQKTLKNSKESSFLG